MHLLCAPHFTQPCDNLATNVSLFPFYRQGTEAQRGGLLAQRPMDQNWTARNADPRSPSSEARELSSEGLRTDSSALRSARCTAHMPRAPGLWGLRRELLEESEIPQAKGALERQKDLDGVRGRRRVAQARGKASTSITAK